MSGRKNDRLLLIWVVRFGLQKNPRKPQSLFEVKYTFMQTTHSKNHIHSKSKYLKLCCLQKIYFYSDFRLNHEFSGKLLNFIYFSIVYFINPNVVTISILLQNYKTNVIDKNLKVPTIISKQFWVFELVIFICLLLNIIYLDVSLS